MATKKRLSQLKSLLDWEDEGNRLPKTKDLFHRQISPLVYLYEIKDKVWTLERQFENKDEEGIQVQRILLKHETLIQLALSILDAVKIVEDRFLNK